MAREASQTVHMMGTSIDLMVVHEEPESVLGEMVERLKIYEQRFSANDASSELAEVNRQAGGGPVKVHPELFHLIKLGKKHSVAADSLLNIAIGPLVQTWRIGFEDARVPAEEEIQALLAVTDPEGILLDAESRTVYLNKKGMQLDLGALAKGYMADRLIDYLKEAGAVSALINLGGNLVTYGPALKRVDRLWRVGIQQPAAARGEAQIILKVRDKSVVTSGIYERKLSADGKDFHHIFDPKTGYPLETELASLTIVSDLSVDGEIWTTRLFGYPPSDIIKKLDRMDGIDGLVLTKEGAILYSKGLADQMGPPAE